MRNSIKLYIYGRVQPNNNEWRTTKMHARVQCFNISLPAWEDLLKFDTAWSSCHWSIYYASAKVES